MIQSESTLDTFAKKGDTFRPQIFIKYILQKRNLFISFDFVRKIHWPGWTSGKTWVTANLFAPIMES